MLYKITNLDTGRGLYFQASTPLLAMSKLKYYLSISDKKAEQCVINKTKSGMHLYLVFRDETYSVRNKIQGV